MVGLEFEAGLEFGLDLEFEVGVIFEGFLDEGHGTGLVFEDFEVAVGLVLLGEFVYFRAVLVAHFNIPIIPFEILLSYF